ncbi:MAG: phage tail protein [Flavobacteriaceae bacterium]|nr:phage tail protein [Flavobacteriaceae bacterium]
MATDNGNTEGANWPKPKFYFEVDLGDELKSVAFQEVSGLSKGGEEVESGAENRFKYRLPALSNNQNLVLKRGIAPTGSKLIEWCSDTLNGVSTIETKDVAVNLINEKGKIIMKWMFYKAYPIKYSISDLKSQEDEVLLETLEFAFTYFETKTQV